MSHMAVCSQELLQDLITERRPELTPEQVLSLVPRVVRWIDHIQIPKPKPAKLKVASVSAGSDYWLP